MTVLNGLCSSKLLISVTMHSAATRAGNFHRSCGHVYILYLLTEPVLFIHSLLSKDVHNAIFEEHFHEGGEICILYIQKKDDVRASVKRICCLSALTYIAFQPSPMHSFISSVLLCIFLPLFFSKFSFSYAVILVLLVTFSSILLRYFLSCFAKSSTYPTQSFLFLVP